MSTRMIFGSLAAAPFDEACMQEFNGLCWSFGVVRIVSISRDMLFTVVPTAETLTPPPSPLLLVCHGMVDWLFIFLQFHG